MILRLRRVTRARPTALGRYPGKLLDDELNALACLRMHAVFVVENPRHRSNADPSQTRDILDGLLCHVSGLISMDYFRIQGCSPEEAVLFGNLKGFQDKPEIEQRSPPVSRQIWMAPRRAVPEPPRDTSWPSYTGVSARCRKGKPQIPEGSCSLEPYLESLGLSFFADSGTPNIWLRTSGKTGENGSQGQNQRDALHLRWTRRYPGADGCQWSAGELHAWTWILVAVCRAQVGSEVFWRTDHASSIFIMPMVLGTSRP